MSILFKDLCICMTYMVTPYYEYMQEFIGDLPAVPFCRLLAMNQGIIDELQKSSSMHILMGSFRQTLINTSIIPSFVPP